MQKSLNFNQVLQTINLVGQHRTVLVRGENGIGKTALYNAVKKLPKFANHISTEAPVDCTMLGDGSVLVPSLDVEHGVSRELPNDRWGVSYTNRKGVNGSRPVLVALDEIGKAPRFMQNNLSPIMYERRIGDLYFPEGSCVMAFTNLSVEGLGDMMQAHSKNRLILIEMRKPTANEWLTFADRVGLNEKVTAYVQTYPAVMESFRDYDEDGPKKGRDLAKENPRIYNPRVAQDAYASPRSLHACSDILNLQDAAHPQDKLDNESLLHVMTGAIGAVTAGEMMAFVKFGEQIPDYHTVVNDPLKAPMCENPTAQLVQANQFIKRAEDMKEIEATAKYVMRMRGEMQNIFAQQAVRSHKVNKFCMVKEFSELLAKHRKFFQ